ncbi:MAG: gamma-glutamylcyclotransferase [Myxococcales bacterium]|nr:gamma-glutamylcyclotransferase [Myxococcales bacterium]
MVAARGAGRVAGELYAVESLLLAKLDAFEEHPHVYRRSFIQTLAGDVVQAYLLRPEQARGLPVMASGCWRRRDEAGERHRAVDLPGGHKP